MPGAELMESMRAVGYTLETSIADLIDNSIAAQARNVWVDFSASGERHIVITDDGRGMDCASAVSAMRLAGVSPTANRSADDLGRFGLGLKTASLAQARCLTLVSKSTHGLAAYRWDLDHIARTKTWSLLKLDASEVEALPEIARLAQLRSGTAVIWENLDQLGASIGPDQDALDQAMRNVREHLALVFHRFIDSDSATAVSLYVNDAEVPKLDPFLRTHRATQKGPTEHLTIDGHTVEIQPYTLPLMNRLSASDRERGAVSETLRASQGFYVYRARRLVIWGTWFRLVPRAQMSKLARVQVDIPNSFDHLWALDIKKSSAVPPPSVRRELKRVSDRIIEPSRRVQQYRGRVSAPQNSAEHVWSVIVDRHTVRYQINRNHPVVVLLGDTLGEADASTLETLLAIAETTFPVQDAYNRLSEDAVPPSTGHQELIDQATALWEIYSRLGKSLDDFIEKFMLVEPFSSHPHFERVIREELA